MSSCLGTHIPLPPLENMDENQVFNLLETEPTLQFNSKQFDSKNGFWGQNSCLAIKMINWLIYLGLPHQVMNIGPVILFYFVPPVSIIVLGRWWIISKCFWMHGCMNERINKENDMKMKPSCPCLPPALPPVKETPRKRTRRAGERRCSMKWSGELEERLSL